MVLLKKKKKKAVILPLLSSSVPKARERAADDFSVVQHVSEVLYVLQNIPGVSPHLTGLQFLEENGPQCRHWSFNRNYFLWNIALGAGDSVLVAKCSFYATY